jgi:hypothetical protein
MRQIAPLVVLAALGPNLQIRKTVIPPIAFDNPGQNLKMGLVRASSDTDSQIYLQVPNEPLFNESLRHCPHQRT